MDQDGLRQSIGLLGPWFHQINLGGIGTRDVHAHPSPAPANHPQWRWDLVRPLLPESVEGLRILDAGCSDGYFCFRLADEGAAQVLGIDRDQAALTRAEFARRVLGAGNVEFRQADIASLAWPAFADGPCHVALFLAVLHQLHNPCQALAALFRAGHLLVLETLALADRHHPLMYWGPDTRITHDPVAGWLPTTLAVRRMLEQAGFVNVSEVETGEAVEFAGPDQTVLPLRRHLYRPLFTASRPQEPGGS